MSFDPGGEDSTIDAFHRGRFHLVQPAGRGHRAGLDAMLLAATVPGEFAGSLADLGAGAGAAGLAVAARCRNARVTLVENEALMAGFARRSLALVENAPLAGRVDVLVADVCLAGRARAAAGLAERSYDFVIFNPPFNPGRGRSSPDPLRRAAHVMPDGQLQAWLRTAAAILRPSGGVSIILRPEMLPELLATMEGRFGAIEMRPVHARESDRAAAIRLVLRAIRGSRKPLSILAPLVLHPRQGNGFTPEATRIINGEAEFFASPDAAGTLCAGQ